MGEDRRPAVLITVAARRVGRVIARTLHGAGYDIALHYRQSKAEAEQFAAELEHARAGSTALFAADLAQTTELPKLILRVVQRFGGLDGLINNASAFYPTPVGEVTEAHWEELFASNAKAPFFLTQAAAPHLRARQGAVVNLVDIYAERPLARHPVYCMAKAALAMMTMALARELGPEVRVNGVAPGAVLWPESGKAYADQQELVARTALKRAGTPEDVAGAVLYLLRDARYVTGEIVRVDGGRALTL
jgi:pteridine reductase